MAIIFQFLIYIFIEFLFLIPGTLIRWSFLRVQGHRITFQECLTYRTGINYLLSLALVIAIVLFLKLPTI